MPEPNPEKQSQGRTTFGWEEGKGPVWKSEAPEIKMALPNTPDAMAEWARREKNSPFTGAKILVDDVAWIVKEINHPSESKYRGTEDLTSEDRAEILRTRYEKVLHSSLNNLEDLGEYLWSLNNPVPYESRPAYGWFGDLMQNIDEQLRDKNLGELGKAVFTRLKIDTKWGQGAERVVEGMGPAFSFYFAGEGQMRILTNIRGGRHNPTGENFETLYSKKLDGLFLTPNQETLLQDLDGTIVKEGFRELAVEYQDDYNFLKLAVASVHQLDVSPTPYVSGTEKMPLSETQIKVIRKLFADPAAGWVKFNGQEVPERMLNWYSMKTSGEHVRRYLALSSTLLTGKYREKITELEKRFGKPDYQQKFDELISEVEAKVKEKVKNWHNRNVIDIKDRLSETVVKNTTFIDLGTMASGELGWGWEYEVQNVNGLSPSMRERFKKRGYVKPQLKKDVVIDCPQGQEKDEVFIVRTSEIGGIYNAFDAQTLMYWMRHIIDYDLFSESRTPLFPPTAPDFRLKFLDMPPDYRPPIDKVLSEDKILAQQLEYLWGTSPEAVRVRGEEFRDGQKFGDFDPKVIEFMKKNLFAFETPFYNNSKAKDYHLTIPVFFPTKVAYLNFWRHFNLPTEENSVQNPDKFPRQEKIQKGNKSVWRSMLLNGIDLSDLDWSVMNKEQLDKYQVNMEMSARWLALLSIPFQKDESFQKEYEKFFENPGTDGIKELSKRNKLGQREVEDTETAVMEVALIPMLVVLAAARNNHVIGPKGKLEPARVTGWLKDVDDWIDSFSNLPSIKANVTNYGNSMAFLAFVYSGIIKRYIDSFYNESANEAFQVARNREKNWKNLGIKWD